MPHSYCVDGTNVVRGSVGYGGPNFRLQEEADTQRLVQAFGQLCNDLDGQIEVELYFDGAFRPLSSPAPNLRLRFTRETPADDLILDRVRVTGGKVTVVTGDGELGRRISEEGARWLRVNPGTALESVLNAIERRFQC